MRLISWLLRAFIFFTLFAFALNNQQVATVHWFFGVQWRSPMVIVVLAAFAAGCAVGVLAMLPSLWRKWRKRQRSSSPSAATPSPLTAPPSSLLPSEFGPAETAQPPPRVGP